MPRRVTSSDGGGRLAILLSLRIGGGACPAGGVGDFTTCLPLGACTLHCFLIRTLDANDLFEHGTLYMLGLRLPGVDCKNTLYSKCKYSTHNYRK